MVSVFFLGVLLVCNMMCCSLCCARSDGWLILVVSHCPSVGKIRQFLFFNRRGTKSNLLHT